MRSAADIASEMDEGLQLLFQKGLELAFSVQADAMASDAPEDRAKLALTFHRLSRSIRQTAALRMRLAREAERSGAEAEARVVSVGKARRDRRKAHIRGAVSAMVWSEYEPEDEEAEAILERLDGVLSGEAETDDFLAEDPQAQIEKLCRAIDYIPPGPPPKGEVSPKATEGASAQTDPPRLKAPQSVPDSSPLGGAPDGFRSSA